MLPQGRQEMIASSIRTIFSQLDDEYVHHQHGWFVRVLERTHPKRADLFADAKEDPLPFTNPLERLSREIKRRTDVVGVFPNPESLFRLTTAVLMEKHDEWAASNRRYLSEGSLKALTEPEEIDQGVIRQLNIA